MQVKLVLNGGIKSCCSVTPTEVVRSGVRAWLPESDELVVVDIQTEAWEPDALADAGKRHLGDSIFPLVYIGGKLALFGGIPNRKNLLAMVSGQDQFNIVESDFVKAAEAMGLAGSGD